MSKLLTTAHLLATAALAIYTLSSASELASLKQMQLVTTNHLHALDVSLLKLSAAHAARLDALYVADYLVAGAALADQPELVHNEVQAKLRALNSCTTTKCVDQLMGAGI